MVDEPVPSLCSSVLPMDADGLPKDPSNRRIEQALCRDFEASVTSLKASTVCGLFARAAKASDLAAGESDIPKELKDEIKKAVLASAIAADASLGAIQFSARAVASSEIPGQGIGRQAC